jgi:uncharacterized protein (TIGR03437 family)
LLAGNVTAQPNKTALIYSTYLGGDSVDIANAVATDAQGNVYIAGQTVSSNFPATAGAYQVHSAGTPSQLFLIGVGQVSDAFVAKIDVSGKLVYATYLGGSGTDIAKAIAVDMQGNAYVAGVTGSANFPVTAGAFQSSAAFIVNGLQQNHIFVTKVNAAGSALVYSTLINGSGTEDARAIAVDSGGNAYITGATTSLDFPVTAGALQKTAAKTTGFSPIQHGYVAKLNAAGSALVYATYLSGSNGAQPNGLALGPAGDATIAGSTSSADFPVTTGAPQTVLSRPSEAFVSRLNAAGNALTYSTFIGGAGAVASAVALDSSGAAYIAGYVENDTPSAGFAAKLNPSGSGLAYSIELGQLVTPSAIAVDASGDAYIAGATTSSSLPVTAGAYQTGYSAAPCPFTFSSPFFSSSIVVNCGDAFLEEIDPAGATLLYATYFGGNGYDSANALALAVDGSIYVAGSTQSANLPATAGSIATHRSEGGPCTDWSSPTASSNFPCDDAFLARFHSPALPALKPFEVVNAASMLPGAIAPGELISLLGTGIGPAQPADLTLDASGLVSTSLNGIRVLFNGIPAPLIHVDASRITLSVPFEMDGKLQAPVAIETNGVAGVTEAIQVAYVDPASPAVAPGIFTVANGTGAAACINQDGSLNGPDNPAPAGSVVGIYLTGLGSTVPPGVDGTVTGLAPLPQPMGSVLVYVGGQAAQVTYAGAAPYLVSGVMQVNFVVPNAPGNAPVFLAAGDVVSSQPGVWIAVR